MTKWTVQPTTQRNWQTGADEPSYRLHGQVGEQVVILELPGRYGEDARLIAEALAEKLNA